VVAEMIFMVNGLPGNGRNSLRNSLVGLLDADCFRSIFEQWPDEVLMKAQMNEMYFVVWSSLATISHHLGSDLKAT
jgi:hypothetical protein